MTYEKLRTIIQLQSLAWTIPMLVLCFVVLWELKKLKKAYSQGLF
jgi:hypothetical protein